MRVAVLVSTSVHPVSGLPRRCGNDAVALELARHLAPRELTVLHAGDPDDGALADYLALGAEEVRVVRTHAREDAVRALLPHVAAADLIVCGARAERGEASGMFPYLLARGLGCPIVGHALSLEARGRDILVTQFLPRGNRRLIEAVLPAVVSVHATAPVRPRHVFARRRSGRIRVIPDAAPRGLWADRWVSEPAQRAPRKLAATQRLKGQARMSRALASDTRGGRVVIEGSDVEKAQVLLAYLREHGFAESVQERSK